MRSSTRPISAAANLSQLGFVANDCRAIAVDSSSNAYVTGKTNAANFPTTAGAFQTALAGADDAFVAKLNATGTALVYSTYLGSSKSSDDASLFIDGKAIDEGESIAVDPAGHAYVTGRTTGSNFPTPPGALKTTHSNDVFAVGEIDPPTRAFADAFITKLNPTGTALLYSTYLGGRGADSGSGIALDAAGSAYVVGTTEARDFPTFNAVQATHNGNRDAFVAKLNPDGSALVYSTYIGGSGGDTGKAIALDASGNAYVTGMTSSTDLPTTAGGTAQKTQQALFAPQRESFLSSKKAVKKIPRGQAVTIQVRNANGLASAPVNYTRPVD